MRKVVIVIVVLVALSCGAVASVLAYNYLKNHKGDAGPELIPLVVASKDLTFGTILSKDDMMVVLYPKGSIPKGSYSSVDSLVGQSSKVFLKEKEPIMDSKLSSKGGGLSLLVSENMRASSIKVDRVSGVSGFVLPGDKVDIIATVKNVGTRSEPTAVTILQNVEVLAAGEEIERKGDKIITVQTVTLLVDPEGAQALALAVEEGKLHLALRNPNDKDLASVKSINRTGIINSSKVKTTTTRRTTTSKRTTTPIKKPVIKKVEPPKENDSLVIFRGTDKTTETPAMEGIKDSTVDSLANKKE